MTNLLELPETETGTFTEVLMTNPLAVEPTALECAVVRVAGLPGLIFCGLRAALVRWLARRS